MRVALDATPLTISSGGLPRYVTELSVALAREFPEDTYYLLSDQPFPMPERAPANLVRGRQPHSAAERRWWLWGIQHAIRQTGAQVFHGTNFEVPYLGSTPAILTIHDLSPWRESAWQLHRHNADADRVRWRTPWLVRLRRARMILTVSEAVRREVIGHFGVAPDRVRAVPLAASSHFRPMAPTSPAQKPFFLFVATLEPRKNVAGTDRRLARIARRNRRGSGDCGAQSGRFRGNSSLRGSASAGRGPRSGTAAALFRCPGVCLPDAL